MPHLSFEYSAGVGDRVNLHDFATCLRDAMAATGIFPLGGIRVRGFCADVAVIADGGAHDFIDISVRLGAGRDLATRQRGAEAIYAAAEAFLRPRIGATPFALSLEMREIDPDLSIKRYNTIHDFLEPRHD